MTAAQPRLTRVAWNALTRFGAQFWAKLLSLLLVPLIIRSAGSAELGRYLMALSLSSIAGAVADLGLTIYLTREVAQREARTEQLDFLGDVLVLKLALALLGYGLLLAVLPVFPLPASTRRLIRVAGLALAPEAGMSTFHAFLNARQRMDLSSAILAGVRLIATLGGAISLAWGEGAFAILWALVIATLLGAFVSAMVVTRGYGLPQVHIRAMMRDHRWGRYVRASLPFAVTGLIAMLYRRLDLLLLGWLHGELTAGWYGAATRVWEAAQLLPASLLDALFPELSRLAARPDGLRRLKSWVGTGGAAMLGAGILLSISGRLAGGAGLQMIYGSGVASATLRTWQILVWAIPAAFLYLLGGHTLYALGQQQAVTNRMLVVGLVNLVLNLALVGRWRHLGAAWALTSSEWLLCLLLFGKAWRALQQRKIEIPV